MKKTMMHAQTRNTLRRFFCLGAASVALIGVAPVMAQDIDYSGLEALYGEPVTTSAIGKPQTVSETPVSMDIITADEIQKSGAIDIPQILARYAGVDVARSFLGYADVNIRGYNQPQSNRLLVLINGRQFYNDVLGSTSWQAIPVQLSEIKQIEIVRGPNSSLFGFNAASGVVNIITYNPLRDDVDQVDLRYGSRRYREATAANTVKVNDNWGVRLSTGYTNSDSFDLDDRTPAGLSSDDGLYKKSAALDTQYNFSDETTMRVEAGFVHADILAPLNTYTAYDQQTLERYVKADLTHDAGSMGVWMLKLYHNSYDSEFRGAPLGNVTNIDTIDNRLNVVQLSNVFSPAAAHTVRLGAEYRNNSITGEAVGTTKDDEFSMDITSGSAMWDWRISDQWNWTAAVRLDHWTTDDDTAINARTPLINLAALDREPGNIEYSYNFGLQYRPTESDTFRLSVGRGLHIPSLAELAFDENFPTSDSYGNPSLKAETNFTVDLGYTHRLHEQNMVLGTNLVYQRIENVITPVFTFTGPLAQNSFFNTGDSESYSAELFARGKLLDDKLSWHVNYTLQAVNEDPSGRFGFDDFEGNTPRHKFNVALGYETGKWFLGADAHYVSSLNSRGFVSALTYQRFDVPIEAYTQVNARVSYDLTDRTKISLDGFNLTDSHYERPDIVAPFATFLGMRGGGEVGRMGIISLRHQF